MCENEDIDPRVAARIEEAFSGESKKIELNLDRLFKLVGPAPRTVPKIIGLKPSEFMGSDLDYFKQLCEEHTYAKVISALTYIRNVAADGNEEVIQKAVDLQEDLKSWRTNAPPDSQSTPDDQTAPSASSESSEPEQESPSEDLPQS